MQGLLASRGKVRGKANGESLKEKWRRRTKVAFS